MRKYILAACALLITMTGQAQIPVLTSSDIGAVGSVYIMGIDTATAGISVGAGGSAQVWDFTALTGDVIDTVEFLDPASTPYATDFPTSDLAIFQSDIGGYGFLETSTTSLEIIGFAADPAGLGQTFILPQKDPFRVAQFPFTYGDSFQDTSIIDATISVAGVIQFADSARYQTTSERVLTADAWGDLTLPSGTTYNSLRIKEISETRDSIWVLVPFFGWQLYQDTTYIDSTFTWWDNSKGYYLCEASYNGGNFNRVTHQDPVPAVSTRPRSTADFQIFPNPTSGTLRIERPSPKSASLEIFNTHGQMLLQTNLREQVQSIEIPDFPDGIYLLRIRNEKGDLSTAKRLVIQH